MRENHAICVRVGNPGDTVKRIRRIDPPLNIITDMTRYSTCKKFILFPLGLDEIAMAI